MPPRTQDRSSTLVRSAAVGAAASIADLFSLFLLVEWIGLGPTTANLPALLLGLVIQYFGNKFFAFRDHRRDHLRQGGLFLIVEIGAFALSAALFHGLVVLIGIPYLLARIVASAIIYLGFSYPLWRRIFRHTPRPSTACP